MKRSGIGRVDLLDLRINQPDLLELLGDPGSARAQALARLLGYERGQTPKRNPVTPPPAGPSVEQPEAKTAEIERRPLRDTVFWYVSDYDALPVDAEGRQRIDQAVAAPEPIAIEAPVLSSELSPRRIPKRFRAEMVEASHAGDCGGIAVAGGTARTGSVRG